MVFAYGVRKSPLGGTDLAGIFERVYIDTFPDVLRFWMVARTQPEPSDVDRDDLVLQVFNNRRECVIERQIPGSRATYQEWLEGAYSYIWLEIASLRVYRPDEFSFQLGTTTHVLKEETLWVEQNGGHE